MERRSSDCILHGNATEDGSHVCSVTSIWYPSFLRYQSSKRSKGQSMKFLILLLLFPLGAAAQTVTPQFTQGSMQSTTTTTQTITETIATEVYGGAYSSWSGTNVTPSGDITNSSTTFSVHTAGDPFQLEITTRAAGTIEEITITEDIDVTSTTTSLSIFSQ